MTPAEAHIWIATFASANAHPEHSWKQAVGLANNAEQYIREREREKFAELEAALSCAQPVVSRETNATNSSPPFTPDLPGTWVPVTAPTTDERLAKIRARIRSPDAPGVFMVAGASDSVFMLEEIDRLRAENTRLGQQHEQTLNAYVGANARLKASQDREAIVQRNREDALDRLRDMAEEFTSVKRLVANPKSLGRDIRIVADCFDGTPFSAGMLRLASMAERGEWGHVPPAAPELRPKIDWHENDGACLWWAFPIAEPPYVGSPLWLDFPSHVTHWQRIMVPTEAG